MPSCAGIGMVTICTLTLVSRSATGTSITRPGCLMRCRTRPNRKTTPRWNCCTTRMLSPAHTPSTPAAASIASTMSIAVTSAYPT
jgi:hypothetical protein